MTRHVWLHATNVTVTLNLDHTTVKIDVLRWQMSQLETSCPLIRNSTELLHHLPDNDKEDQEEKKGGHGYNDRCQDSVWVVRLVEVTLALRKVVVVVLWHRGGRGSRGARRGWNIRREVPEKKHPTIRDMTNDKEPLVHSHDMTNDITASDLEASKENDCL